MTFLASCGYAGDDGWWASATKKEFDSRFCFFGNERTDVRQVLALPFCSQWMAPPKMAEHFRLLWTSLSPLLLPIYGGTAQRFSDASISTYVLD